MSQAIGTLCSGRVTRWGSNSSSSSPITAHSIRAFRISDGIRVLSFVHSSGSELSKTATSSLSLHAVYMLPNSHMLMCKQPLYDIEMQHSFPAFAAKATKGQGGNYRKLAKPRDKKNHENMIAKSDELSDVQDYDERPKHLVSEFSADSYDRTVKPSSTAASSVDEIVALFMKLKSQPRDDSHVKDKDQEVQTSEAKPTGTVGSTFLEVLQRHLPQVDVQKNKALHFESPSRQRILTTQSLKNNLFPKALHTKSVEISASSIKESLVVRQQGQQVSASCQPGGRGLVDGSVNLTQANKTQLESNSQSTTPHMLCRSGVTSVNSSESMPDQLASSLIEHMDLSTLRIPEMRIIAKSLGLKGYSKLKKVELLELLKKNSN